MTHEIDGSGSTGDDDLWCVMLPSGESRRGTLDQLDDAFQAGAIDASTLVLGPGETEWKPLGALAGLETEPAPAPALSVAPPSMAANSLRPVMTDLDDVPVIPDELRPRSRGMIAAFAGLALLGGGAVAFAMGVGSTSTTSGNAAAAIAAPTTPPVAVAKPPAATPDSIAAAAVSSASAASRLTAEQLKTLADLDKQRERAAEERKRNRPTVSGPSRRYKPEGPSFDVAPAQKPGKACTCKRGDPLCTCF